MVVHDEEKKAALSDLFNPNQTKHFSDLETKKVLWEERNRIPKVFFTLLRRVSRLYIKKATGQVGQQIVPVQVSKTVLKKEIVVRMKQPVQESRVITQGKTKQEKLSEQNKERSSTMNGGQVFQLVVILSAIAYGAGISTPIVVEDVFHKPFIGLPSPVGAQDETQDSDLISRLSTYVTLSSEAQQDLKDIQETDKEMYPVQPGPKSMGFDKAGIATALNKLGRDISKMPVTVNGLTPDGDKFVSEKSVKESKAGNE